MRIKIKILKIHTSLYYRTSTPKRHSKKTKKIRELWVTSVFYLWNINRSGVSTSGRIPSILDFLDGAGGADDIHRVKNEKESFSPQNYNKWLSLVNWNGRYKQVLS